MSSTNKRYSAYIGKCRLFTFPVGHPWFFDISDNKQWKIHRSYHRSYDKARDAFIEAEKEYRELDYYRNEKEALPTPNDP